MRFERTDSGSDVDLHLDVLQDHRVKAFSVGYRVGTSCSPLGGSGSDTEPLVPLKTGLYIWPFPSSGSNVLTFLSNTVSETYE